MHSKSKSKRQKIGLESQQKGRSFEENVAELYRLLHYEIEHGRLFSGRQVDLFLKGKFGDLTIYRAIECKAGPVNTQHIDTFLNKYRLVQNEYPSVQGTIVSGVSFSDSVVSHANQIGIQLITYRDLTAQLFDGHAYVKELIKECESNTRYSINNYIEQFIQSDVSSDIVAADTYLKTWLHDETWNQMTLLGDLGTGKTFLSRMFAYNLALEFLESPLEKPFPVRIDLRHADREFSLEGLILNHLSRSGLPQVSFDIFLYSLFEGKIVLILDGFDEMAARVSPLVTRRNFHELARCVQKRSNVLLTCRTHYFKSRTEEEEVILGSRKKFDTNVRELYWELISRKGYRIAYLNPFTFSQVESYVQKTTPKTAKTTLKKIRNTYNLVELSQRPLLLDMIVKSINKIRDQIINIATLYEIFTEAWIHREQWREVIPPETKIDFLRALSYSLWQEELTNIHYSKLLDYLHKQFGGSHYNPQDIIELDHEIRTASFLSRNESGYYGFAHKSFAEYFLAHYLATELKNNNIECLRIRRLTPEVIGFLGKMVKCEEVEQIFKNILTSKYQFQISENALVCLYGILRERIIAKYSAENTAIHLPENTQLNGAKLDQINLENAVLENANLEETTLTEAILINTVFTGSKISNANLKKANLESAILFNTNLTNSNLNSANLEQANLEWAKFNYANLTDAVLLNVDVTGADFFGANGEGALILEDDIAKFVELLGSEDLVEDIFKLNIKRRSDESRDFIKDVYPFLKRISHMESLRVKGDADEILSRVLLEIISPSVIERLKGIKKSELESYIHSTVRRIASDVREYENHVYDKLGEPISLEFVYCPLDDPELNAITSDLKTKINYILDNKLSDNLKKIVGFKFYEGYSIKEIAETENLSVSTVHYRLNKAKEILQHELSGIDI